LRLSWTNAASIPIEEVQAAVDGAICHEQAVKLRECLAHIDELQAHREQIHKEIMNLADKYAYPLELLRTVPGFSANPMTAIAVIAEIGADMSVFPTAKHLTSWAGCCPRNDQSGGKFKSTRISRAGAYLKPLLVQVANALIKSDKHPEFRNRYAESRLGVVTGKRSSPSAGCFSRRFGMSFPNLNLTIPPVLLHPR
jgi:Transposase and inactivated derivatives